MISENYSLGSAGNVSYRSAAYKAEGFTIRGNVFLPTTGRGIEIRACLSCVIANNQIDQANDTALKLDGSESAIADVLVEGNWFGRKASATAAHNGLVLTSNVVEARIVNNSIVGWKQCGLRMQADKYSVQNILVSGLRALDNGVGEGTGDLCAIPDHRGGGVSYTVRDSWLMSAGNGQRPAIEHAGAVGTWRNNRLSTAPTKSVRSSWVDNFGDDRDASTGKYNGWAQFKANPTCASGSFGKGVGIDTGYTRERNAVTFRVRLRISTAAARGSCAGVVSLALPVAPGGGTAVVVAGRDLGTNARAVQGWNATGVLLAIADLSGRTIAVEGADVVLSGSYEAAP